MTSPSTPSLKPKRLDSFRLTAIAFAALAGLIIMGGIASIAYHRSSRVSEQSREAERIRQQGIPTDVEELSRFYFVDAEADRLGVELADSLEQFSLTWEVYDEVHFFDRRGNLEAGHSPENVEILRALLTDNAEELADVRRLVNTPHDVRYPLDFAKGLDLEFPFASRVRFAVRLFAVDAQIAALDGDAARVVQDCLDAIQTAETLRDTPILILQLVRIACLTIALEQLEYAVNAIAIPRESLQPLRETLQQLDLDGSTERGMIGELCIGDVDLLLNHADDQSFAGFLRNFPFLPDIWSANLFLANSEIMQVAALPPWERTQAAEQATERVMDRLVVFHVFEHLMVPAIGRAYETENRILGIIASAQAGLAVLDHAAATGALPEDLNALVPAYLESVPLDPFDGQPVRYRRTETGFVVYSIAHNRVDDGGTPPPEFKKIGEAGDLVFRVLDVSPYLRQ